jgi:adenine specific DNA methylase Mod
MRDDMGPNKPYYPNHGYYVNESVTLNSDCFYHPDRPDDFVDGNGYYMYRPAQTLYHEMGHSFDDFHEKEGVPLSQQDAWLKLSGWSENFKLGLQRLIIKDKGAPEVIGEWFYDPKAGFTRFYARRNPWDDWADSFSFFVGGMKKLPDNKQEYFEKLLGKYYGK